MRKNLLFYTSAKSPGLVSITGFLATDITLLKDLGFNVTVTSSYTEFIKFWKYDIVFAYFWTKSIVPVFLARIFNKSVYVTGGIDQIDSGYNKSRFDLALRALFFTIVSNLSTKSFVVSKADFTNIKKYCLTRDNLVFAPHSIDSNAFNLECLKTPNLFSTVAWMESIENVKRKGVDSFLYVFKEYLKIAPDSKFIIIGSLGAGSEYLKNIINELDMGLSVEFLGRISESEKIYHLLQSQFYVQISIYEGFGIAALEGLAAKNIVIHTGMGGLSDVINTHGLLVDRNLAPSILAEQIHKLAINPQGMALKVRDVNQYIRVKFDNSVRKEIFYKYMVK